MIGSYNNATMKNTNLGEKVLSTWDAEATYGISAATINYWCKRRLFPAELVRARKRNIYEFRAIDFALFLHTAKAGKHRKVVEMIPAGDLTFDPRLPGRAQVYLDTVEAYVVAKRNGDELPPIVAARVDGRLVVIEGAHRYQSCLVNREAVVPVQLLEGLGWDDAFALALEANSRHGRPLNAPDKRTKVLQTLQHPAYTNLSTRELAELIHVSHNLVAVVRREMEDDSKPPEGASNGKHDDAITPARIAAKIRGQLKFLAITHPAVATRISDNLKELDTQI